MIVCKIGNASIIIARNRTCKRSDGGQFRRLHLFGLAVSLNSSGFSVQTCVEQRTIGHDFKGFFFVYILVCFSLLVLFSIVIDQPWVVVVDRLQAQAHPKRRR